MHYAAWAETDEQARPRREWAVVREARSSRTLALAGGSQTGAGAHPCESAGRGENPGDCPRHGVSRATSGVEGNASKNHHRPRQKGAECKVQDRLGHANIQNTMVYMRYTTVTRDAQTQQLFASHCVV